MTAVDVGRVRRLVDQLEDAAMEAAAEAMEFGELTNAQVLGEVASLASACVGAMEAIDL